MVSDQKYRKRKMRRTRSGYITEDTIFCILGLVFLGMFFVTIMSVEIPPDTNLPHGSTPPPITKYIMRATRGDIVRIEKQIQILDAKINALVRPAVEANDTIETPIDPDSTGQTIR